MERIRSLDGWRGIAILIVLADHYEYALLGEAHSAIWGIGQHGVTIFFVLSGYLITLSLITKESGLATFYKRRFFRLMPVAWTYLIFVLLLQLAFRVNDALLQYVVPSLLFYRNFIPTGAGNTGHFWSLSLEEQFYFIWPAILLTAGKRKAKWIAIAGAVGCAAYRFHAWDAYNKVGVDTATQVRADALLIGCALALILYGSRRPQLWYPILTSLALPALAYLVFCIVHFRWLPPLTESVAIAVLVGASTNPANSMLSRTLSWTPLAWVGRASYSIYVWQQFFMNYRSPLFLLVGVPILSIASFRFVELPFQQFGRKPLFERKDDAAPLRGGI